MSSMTYGNDSFYLTYQYDALDRLEKVCYNGNVRYEYQYTSDGKLHGVIDHQSGVGYLYGYNVEGKLSEYVQYDLDDMTNTLSIFYTYNDQGQIEQVLSSLDYPRSDGSAESYYFTEYYAYDELDNMTHLLQQYLLADILVIGFEYDGVQRLTKKTVAVDGTTDFTHEINYTYADWSSGKYLSSQIATYTTKVGNNAEKKYTYTYDANGNITKIVEEIDDSDDKITQYTYDNLGQLIREDNPYRNSTYVYTYDNNGNRLAKQTYAYTTSTLGAVNSTVSYTYGEESWGDLLTAYNGMSITYDEIGNPLSYYNGGIYTFNWTDGRRLTSATKTGMGTVSYSFTYNDEGIRTSKTSGSTTHYYTLDGSRIVSEEWGNYFAVYLYDESGAPIGMQIRQSSMAADTFYTYYFEKNLQGDIIGVYNSSGALVYSYAYDAWGNFTATKHISSDTFASYNPFRYRGYYYDTDFGFYYLNSRYYDPITGRFINADGHINANGDMIGYNMFAYCSNNPIMNVDPTGEWSWKTVGYIAAGIAVAAITATFVACTAGAILGVVGVATATVQAVVTSGIIVGTVAGTAEVCRQAIESDGEDFDLGKVSETSSSATITQVIDTLVLNGGTAFGTMLDNNPLIHSIAQAGTSMALTYGSMYITNRLKSEDTDGLAREVSEDYFSDIMVPIFKEIIRSAFE